MIARCVSCDGYGWHEDELAGRALDCDWCHGIGYVYRDERGVDYPIPEEDYEKVAGQIEELELQRLREIGYTGKAKKPWEQAIRRGRNLLNNGDDSPS